VTTPRPISNRDLELLSAYVDDALSAAARARLELRLDAEPELRAALDDLRETAQLLRAAPRLEVPRNFTLDPAKFSRRAPWFVRFGVFRVIGAAGMVAALVLIVFGILFSNNAGSRRDLQTGGGFAYASTLVTPLVESAVSPASTELMNGTSTPAPAIAALPTQTPLPTFVRSMLQSATATADESSRDAITLATATLMPQSTSLDMRATRAAAVAMVTKTATMRTSTTRANSTATMPRPLPTGGVGPEGGPLTTAVATQIMLPGIMAQGTATAVVSGANSGAGGLETPTASGSPSMKAGQSPMVPEQPTTTVNSAAEGATQSTAVSLMAATASPEGSDAAKGTLGQIEMTATPTPPPSMTRFLPSDTPAPTATSTKSPVPAPSTPPPADFARQGGEDAQAIARLLVAFGVLLLIIFAGLFLMGLRSRS